ncbi:Testis-specific chromodomain protein [Fusarium beomiforme]|uniref:Testis-specific chromodomain protein n=1 Tax=Fusarium beomiforme TaxID=44412 RepID=A0A9P5AR11_9HYPO|nr:Testis-specific chromodomain protein [Fusarium beomiforme]
MPPTKSRPAVFYARDKSPMEEHNGPRASIENDDDEEKLPKLVSDLVDYQSGDEEFESPEPEDAGQVTEPAKRALSPEDETEDEAANAKRGPPAKRQRRAQADVSATPRRSERIASTSSLEDDQASIVKTNKPATVKRGRGRPPTKSKATSRKAEVATKRSPGRPPVKQKVTRGESTTEWEVEKVLDSRFDDASKQLFYQIKWKGFSNKENTWEPRENLGNCLKLIRDYEKNH